MVSSYYTSLQEIEERLCIQLKGKYILGVMHLITEEANKAEKQAERFLSKH